MVTIHAQNETNFNNLGLGALGVTECTITEKAGNYCELQATIPISDKHANEVACGRIICAEMPLRESPEINVPSGSGTETRQIWVNSTSAALSLYSKPAAGVRTAVLASGEECQKLSEVTQSGTTFFRVAKTNGGAVGYIAQGNLTNTGRTVEVQTGTDQPSGTITLELSRRQPFRIYKVERNSEERALVVYGQHLTYDFGCAVFKHNIPQTSKTINTFWADHANSTYMVPDITGFGYELKDYTNLPFKINAKMKTVVEVLCDEEGALEQVDGCLIRDGTTLYIVPRVSRSSGYEIRLGKNLLTATATENCAEVVTAIRPYGKKSDGSTPLYGDLVTASNVSTFGNFAKVRYIEYNVQATDSTTAAENAAKAKLVQLAQADLDGAPDALNTGTNTVETTFVDLYANAAYASFANTYKLHLYDLVRVFDEEMGIDANMMLNEYTYDCLRGEYTAVRLADLKTGR